jgi:hypothetical protein
MTEGFLYALLGLLGSSALGVFHKLADTLKRRPAPVNALLYGWSLAFIAMPLVPRGNELHTPAGVATLAIPFGISASIAILAFQAGIRHGDIATNWLAINLSSGLPTVASILIYHEPVGLQRAIALSLIPVSMPLPWKDKRDAERRHE